MSIVDEMDQLKKVAYPPSMAPSAPTDAARADSYRKLGHQRSSHGLARAGLEDSLRGYAIQAGIQIPKLDSANLRQLIESLIEDKPEFPKGDSFAHIVQLAEGLRIYARDVDFSREKDGLTATAATMSASMLCFNRAIELKDGQSGKQQAWALAHRGAARTMGYWLKKTLGDGAGGEVFGATSADGGVFELAIQDFKDALKLDPAYAWCKQFQAFLLTIRGEDKDFAQAQALLDTARDPKGPRDSSLERSISILHFNLMQGDGSEQTARAKASLNHALEALKGDHENFVAAFYAAAALQRLVVDGVETEQVFDSAIQSARLRAQNSISQAYAVLIGLSVLDSNRGVESPRECNDYLKLAKAHTPDLETRIVFDRAIRQLLRLPKVDPGLRDELKEFLDTYKSEAPAADKPITAKKDSP